jgi:hypothetical protein
VKAADLYGLEEDERIKMIGETASAGIRVAVCLEKNDPAKCRRYLRKLAQRYPSVVLLEQIDGPTPLIVTLKFGVKASS